VRHRLALALALLVFLGACGSGGSSAPGTGAATRAAAPSPAPLRTGVRLVSVGRFDQPLFVTAAPGDRRRILVVEQDGRIVVVRDGRRLARPFLDLRSRVLSGDEQGLLSLAFAPDYATSGRVYVYYTGRDARQHVVELRRASADRADPSSARELLSMDDPESNHNGGLLLFGPDRHLYIGTGDGGGGYDEHGARGNAQDLGSLLGKILRIDPVAAGGRPYTVPASNPFVRRAGARPEVYAYGLRNPWRFSFDRRTGDLSIGDVGQEAIEEVDFVRRGRGAGANFGWRPWEGTRRNFDEPAPGALRPVLEHTHAQGWCSVTGGVVVRDPRVPALAGRYVYGDLCEGRLRIARLRAGRLGRDRPLARVRRVEGLSSFGEDALGRVYVVSINGPVFRLASRR
jgi:glucose/arabinose dehydrogenase